MKTMALDPFGFDLQNAKAALGGALAMLERHPNYGVADESDGEMLCEVGYILLDVRRKIDAIYDALDGLTLASSSPAAGGAS